jgi:hypothetical protein
MQMKINKLNTKFLTKLKLNKSPLNYFKSILVNRGFDNFVILSDYANRLWPHWIHKYLDPNQKNMSYENTILTIINNKFRNWTYLKEKNTKTTITVDPHGLIFIENSPYSIDFWIAEEDNFYFYAKSKNVKQKYHPQHNTIETSHSFNQLNIVSSTFFRSLPQKHNILFCDNKITNTSNTKKSLSFFISIRPYDLEGVTSLKKIQYVQSNAFLINSKLSICLDNKPDNILCLPFSHGDVSQFHNKLEMIFQATCNHKKASGVAQFNLNLDPGESKIISFKSPFTKNKISKYLFSKKYKIENLKLKINNLKKLSSSQSIIDSSVSKTETQIKTPDKKINTFLKSIYAQLSSSYNYTDINTGIYFNYLYNSSDFLNYIILLHKFGYSNNDLNITLNNLYFKKVLKELKSQKFAYEKLGQWFDQVYYLYNSKILTLTKEKLLIIKDILSYCIGNLENFNTINTKILNKRNCERKNKKRNYLIDNLSVLQSIKTYKELLNHSSIFSTKKLNKEFEKTNHAEIVLTNGIQEFIKTTTKKTLIKDLISPNLSQTVTLNSIECTQYFTKLFPTKTTLIQKTIEEIKTQYFHNGIVYSGINPSGYPLHSNLSYADILYNLNDTEYFNFLNSLLNLTTDTYTLPNVIHLTTKCGSEGDGHNILITTLLALKLIKCFIEENPASLELFKHTPKEWLVNEKLYITNINTSFGEFSFQLTPKEKTVELNFNLSETSPCAFIIIHVPNEFKKFSISENIFEISKPDIKIPINSKKVIFHKSNENK